MTAEMGPLALVGGAEWTEGCDFDAELLTASGARDVAVLPTAAAFELPQQALARARSWFGALGATVTAVNALDRAGAHEQANVDVVRRARLIYIASGSAMHLLSVLKRTPLWDAVVEANRAGAVVAAAGASASVLCDAMVDPRGGGFGVGLGLVDQLALIPRYERWSAEKSRRTVELAPKGLVLAGLPARTALIADGAGRWRVSGAGDVRLFRDGHSVELTSLQQA